MKSMINVNKSGKGWRRRLENWQLIKGGDAFERDFNSKNGD